MMENLNNITPAANIGDYVVLPLTKEMAVRYQTILTELANLIPKVHYTVQDILAESSAKRNFLEKWKHSLIVFAGKNPVAFIMGYERRAEDHPGYRENSIYISELAVDSSYQGQGIAKSLLKVFFEYNPRFFHLKGKIVYTVQTNAASWNQPVINLYQSFGFCRAGHRYYENRTDVVLKRKTEGSK
jgi:ribosomal protein S18 acetylase RimI-like enzyme